MDTFKDRLLSLFDADAKPSHIAAAIGMSIPGFMRIYNEGFIPKADGLIKIHEVTGCDLTWLLTGETTGTTPSRLQEPRAAYNISDQSEGEELLQRQLDKTDKLLKNLKEVKRIGQIGDFHLTDVKNNPVDIDEFVFIPLYDVSVSAGHGAWADDTPPKSTLAFRRDWLEVFITTDFSNLSVVMVKGDSMAGVLNDKDAILIDHSRTEASDGLYALRIGNETFVKRVQRLPHALRITSANPEYDPFEVPLQNGDSSDNSVSIIGKVVWLGRAL